MLLAKGGVCRRSHAVNAALQLIDDRGHQDPTTDERARPTSAGADVRMRFDRTFMLKHAHTGAWVSEVLAIRVVDVDLDAGAAAVLNWCKCGLYAGACSPRFRG